MKLEKLSIFLVKIKGDKMFSLDRNGIVKEIKDKTFTKPKTKMQAVKKTIRREKYSFLEYR